VAERDAVGPDLGGARPGGGLSEPEITLRPARDGDREHLFAVYASARAEELVQTGWSDDEKEHFLRLQFEAQDRQYREHYPGAEFMVIEVGRRPAGRIYVHRGAREIRLMDIALLPEHRSRGIGSRLIRTLQTDAAAAGVPVGIHVELFNPARRLYERLGFAPVEERGFYLFMEWRPAGR
jgi:ribosomal protein S18 acetylase RimI-like enzyme